MEASALRAPATLPETRILMGAPLLRFRSDEQLVALFRAGHDEAFRAIHERYHKRLFIYARQMLHGRQDAEDALQDVFVRAYAGLRASDHDLALRAWLFRVAHNRCIDELRRPAPPPPEVLQLVRSTVHDPLAEIDIRESLRRLIADIRRLPEQQRSALLMRELVGMSYADLSVSLGISVGAVKSLLVRARVALAQAAEARDTSCSLIRAQLVEAHDRGLRPNANARKHMRDCVGCKSFRRELRGMSRQLAAVAPAVGPLGVLAKTLGLSGGAGGGAAGGGGLALLGGGGATASAGGVAVGVNHLATLLVAAAATAGGAAAIQHTIIAPVHHPLHARAGAAHRHRLAPDNAAPAAPTGIQAIAGEVEATVSTAPKLAATADSSTLTAKAKLRHKMFATRAGRLRSSGAAGLSTSSAGSATYPTGAAGLQDGSASSSSSCSAPAAGEPAAGSSQTAPAPSPPPPTAPASTSGSATGSASTTSAASTANETPVAQTPCVLPPSSSSTGLSSATATSSPTSGSQTSPNGTSSATSSPTSGSQSGSASSSPTTGSSGGSTPSK